MGASFDTGNLGVSALAASLVNLVREARPDAEIFFFMGNRTSASQQVKLAHGIERIPVVNYRMSPRGPLQRHLLWIFFLAALQRLVPSASVRKRLVRSNPCLKALSEADFVGDIHGGDSFSDIYGLWSFILGCIPDIITLLLGKRLVLLPQTYGPYKSRLAQWFARAIISRAGIVLSRDREGIDVIRDIAGKSSDANRVGFCPDVAFSLAALRPPEGAITPTLMGEHLVGLNISGLLYNGGFSRDNMFGLNFDYQAFVYALAERILELTDANLLLVPHTFADVGHVESDPDACRDVYSALAGTYKDRVHLVARACDQSEIKGIIGQCDMFIGSRMHACIAAISQGIPTIGLAYSRKFRGVFESVGLGDMVIDARSTESGDAIGAVISGYRDRTGSRTVIKEKVETAMELLRAVFRSTLESRDPQ